MKKILLLLLVISFQSCIQWESDDYIYESNYEPILESRTIFENSITVQSSKPISTAGKIYVKDNYIFINDVDEGFHVFNNINPEEPEPISFINVPGATDLAIRGNIIFVHHFVDLITIKYDFDSNQILSVGRTENVFPALNSPDGFPAEYFEVTPNDVIVGYQLKN